LTVIPAILTNITEALTSFFWVNIESYLEKTKEPSSNLLTIHVGRFHKISVPERIFLRHPRT